MRAVVIVQCPKCKARREVGPGEIPGEIPEGELPMCGDCLFPMFAIRVEARR